MTSSPRCSPAMQPKLLRILFRGVCVYQCWRNPEEFLPRTERVEAPFLSSSQSPCPQIQSLPEPPLHVCQLAASTLSQNTLWLLVLCSHPVVSHVLLLIVLSSLAGTLEGPGLGLATFRKCPLASTPPLDGLRSPSLELPCCPAQNSSPTSP